MTEDQASLLIADLANGTSGWHGDPEAVGFYIEQISDWDYVLAARAIRRVLYSWMELARPPFAILLSAYEEEEHAVMDRQALVHGRARCNGSGWVPGVDGMLPCSQCNPFLTGIFANPAWLRMWRNGTPTAHLVDLPDRFRMPEACRPYGAEDPDDMPVTPEVGREIAWNVYFADCRARQVEPMSQERFMFLVGGVV